MDSGLDGRRFEVIAIARRFQILIAGPPLLFLAVFYFYPLIRIIGLSFMPSGMWEPGQLRQLVTTNYYIRTLWFTSWQAALSTGLTLAVAML
jgi:thiamine transport system permease protein